jgi:hypothetical protein
MSEGRDRSAVAGRQRRNRLGRAGLAAALAAVASAAGLADCTTTSCTAVAKASLVVTVVDAAGKRVCDAVVNVTDGPFSAALASNFGDRYSCAYVGPYERAGTYSLEVRAGNAIKRLDGVKVTADVCHVRPREMTVALGR